VDKLEAVKDAEGAVDGDVEDKVLIEGEGEVDDECTETASDSLKGMDEIVGVFNVELVVVEFVDVNAVEAFDLNGLYPDRCAS
jgi:hypothetical protein